MDTGWTRPIVCQGCSNVSVEQVLCVALSSFSDGWPFLAHAEWTVISKYSKRM